MQSVNWNDENVNTIAKDDIIILKIFITPILHEMNSFEKIPMPPSRNEKPRFYLFKNPS